MQVANTLLLHLAGSTLPVPQPQPAVDGQFTSYTELPLAASPHGRALHAVRLLTFLPGTVLSELPPDSMVRGCSSYDSASRRSGMHEPPTNPPPPPPPCPLQTYTTW